MTALHSPPPGQLIALHATGTLPNGAPLPSRIVMLKWGENKTSQGPVIVGMKTFQAQREWPAMGYGEVILDFNHNSLPTHESYRGEPVTIAARARPIVTPGVGLVFDDVRWTDEGRAYAAHYRDLSPVVKMDDHREVIFCHSGALARNGAVEGLHLYSAGSRAALSDSERAVMKVLNISEDRWQQDTEPCLTLFAADGRTNEADAESEVRKRLGLSQATWDRMNPPASSLRAFAAGGINRQGLLALLKMGPDATDDDLRAALEALNNMQITTLAAVVSFVRAFSVIPLDLTPVSTGAKSSAGGLDRELVCGALDLPISADDATVNLKIEALTYAQRLAEHPENAAALNNAAEAARVAEYAKVLGVPVSDLARPGGESDPQAAAIEMVAVQNAQVLARMTPEERALKERFNISDAAWAQHART